MHYSKNKQHSIPRAAYTVVQGLCGGNQCPDMHAPCVTEYYAIKTTLILLITLPLSFGCLDKSVNLVISVKTQTLLVRKELSVFKGYFATYMRLENQICFS